MKVGTRHLFSYLRLKSSFGSQYEKSSYDGWRFIRKIKKGTVYFKKIDDVTKLIDWWIDWFWKLNNIFLNKVQKPWLAQHETSSSQSSKSTLLDITQKRSIFTTSKTDCQLLHQKVCQRISVMKTIPGVLMSSRQNVN